MYRTVFGIGVALLATACDGDLNSVPAPPSQNVSIVATVGTRTAVGDSVTLHIANSGPDSGMEVPHLHFHVLGGRRLGGLG